LNPNWHQNRDKGQAAPGLRLSRIIKNLISAA
jgi:hypothetical protein